MLNAVKKVCNLTSSIFILLITAYLQAESLLTATSPDKEYLPITGLPEFTKHAAKLAYGADSVPLKEGAVSP